MPHLIEVVSDDKPEGASSIVANSNPDVPPNQQCATATASLLHMYQHLNQNEMLISITDSKHCAKGRNRVYNDSMYALLSNSILTF
jgi:hypothetical protein